MYGTATPVVLGFLVEAELLSTSTSLPHDVVIVLGSSPSVATSPALVVVEASPMQVVLVTCEFESHHILFAQELSVLANLFTNTFRLASFKYKEVK